MAGSMRLKAEFIAGFSPGLETNAIGSDYVIQVIVVPSYVENTANDVSLSAFNILATLQK